jgi:predicted RNA binding protein YcfA (HicA-like mRNA interferase family)
VPPKIRELETALQQAGYDRKPGGGKGSHRRYKHPLVSEPVTISGHPGHDAKPYQEKQVREAVRRARDAERKQDR